MNAGDRRVLPLVGRPRWRSSRGTDRRRSWAGAARFWIAITAAARALAGVLYEGLTGGRGDGGGAGYDIIIIGGPVMLFEKGIVKLQPRQWRRTLPWSIGVLAVQAISKASS